ncbi:hypothetical protein A2532_01080 [Candidatus Wolfebacteria bacterium RIFOXYD2_FULL_48_11]|nr:MAG: hypothetical protein A2532_01080 [Candidatus Wolfebacteria bacterium RIFOXYD2_FULL_48_11]
MRNFDQKEHEKRKRIAKTLHLSGIPTNWIAMQLGINPRTVARLGDKSARGRPPMGGKAFQKVLWHYANYDFQNKKDREIQWAKKLIEEWLGVEAVTATFRSLDMLTAALRLPDHAPEQRRYVELLKEVFSNKMIEARLSAKSLWYNYLSDIATERILPPKNTAEMEKGFAAYTANALRRYIAPRWSPTAHQYIDQVLKTLPAAREAKVIRLRFGIGRKGEAQTLQQIADALNISKERVRQIEASALQKLCHPSQKGKLGYLMNSKYAV